MLLFPRSSRSRAVVALVRSSLAAVVAAGAFAVVSCGGDAPTGPAAVASLYIAQPLDTLILGDSAALAAQPLDARNRVLAGQSVTWTSSDPSVVRVTGSEVYGVALGSAVVTATSGAATGTVTVVVRNLPVKSIVLPFTTRTLTEGDTASIAPAPALLTRDGTPAQNATVAYTSSNTGVATVDPISGLIRAMGPGTAVVTATSDGATASLTVTVVPAPIARLRVIPSAVFIAPGASWHVKATAFGAQGNTLSNRTFTYETGNAATATVPAPGLISGVASGTTTVTVRSGDASVAVPVTVAPAGPGSFSIDVRSFGPVDQTVMAAARAAANRWAQVITGSLPAYRVDVNANECGKGTPAVHETVTNLIVYISTDSIDGPSKTAGEGGPCVVRDPPAAPLTALGFLTIDKADVASIASAGVLNDLLTHEIGHILGIGTLWDPSEFSPPLFPGLTSGLGGNDPVFLGHATRVASAQLGFTPDSSAGVPIENTGGAGTRDGHWRATVFGNELMTGTLHRNSNPLSLVTADALADFGYVVAPTAADEFSVLNTTTGTGVSGQRNAPLPGYEVIDRITPPRFAVTRSGRRRTLIPR